jgi:hypothetical protein
MQGQSATKELPGPYVSVFLPEKQRFGPIRVILAILCEKVRRLYFEILSDYLKPPRSAECGRKERYIAEDW